MGSSPHAKLAWGIDFGDPNNTSEGFDFGEIDVDTYDLEHEMMPGLFGFTEEAPSRQPPAAPRTSAGHGGTPFAARTTSAWTRRFR